MQQQYKGGKKKSTIIWGDAPTYSLFTAISNYSDNSLGNFMNSGKRCVLLKYTLCSLFIAAEQEFDKLFTLSLSKSNLEFASPPQ